MWDTAAVPLALSSFPQKEYRLQTCRGHFIKGAHRGGKHPVQKSGVLKQVVSPRVGAGPAAQRAAKTSAGKTAITAAFVEENMNARGDRRRKEKRARPDDSMSPKEEAKNGTKPAKKRRPQGTGHGLTERDVKGLEYVSPLTSFYGATGGAGVREKAPAPTKRTRGALVLTRADEAEELSERLLPRDEEKKKATGPPSSSGPASPKVKRALMKKAKKKMRLDEEDVAALLGDDEDQPVLKSGVPTSSKAAKASSKAAKASSKAAKASPEAAQASASPKSAKASSKAARANATKGPSRGAIGLDKAPAQNQVAVKTEPLPDLIGGGVPTRRKRGSKIPHQRPEAVKQRDQAPPRPEAVKQRIERLLAHERLRLPEPGTLLYRLRDVVQYGFAAELNQNIVSTEQWTAICKPFIRNADPQGVWNAVPRTVLAKIAYWRLAKMLWLPHKDAEDAGGKLQV